MPKVWGLRDMHGNISELCADWYGDGYYERSPTDDPTGPTTGSGMRLGYAPTLKHHPL